VSELHAILAVEDGLHDAADPRREGWAFGE